MLMFIKTLTALLAALSIVKADRPVFGPEDADSYDNGTYGRAPEERFHTVDLPAYRMLRRTWDDEKCVSDDKFFLGIRGRRLWHTGPVIYDNDGHQVWYAEDVQIPYNFRMQWYQGQQFLTWWNGDDEGGHGSGYHYMYDSHYREYKRISAHGNYSADMHEFLITPEGTALLTIYDPVHADLSEYGVTVETESYIADCLFQEIDLETDELLFEWRASEHFSFDDCYNPHVNKTGVAHSVPPPPHRTSSDDEDHPAAPLRKPRAWDFFHINSVAKDIVGNYLISSRYSHSLTYISHADGSIIWQLGGKNNDFSDISAAPYSGYATSLAWQHHVQLDADEPNILLVFDNQAVNWNKTRPARVLKIRLDTTAMTAEVIAAAEHPQEYIVPSQGSVQQLPSGNLFVGYGFASAMTEFSPDGTEVVCDWQYGALHAKLDGEYSAGMIQSYRSFKQPWKGWPLDVPKVKIQEIDTRQPLRGSAPFRPPIVQSGTVVHSRSEIVGENEASGDAAPVQADTVLYVLQSKKTKMWISWNGATEVKAWTIERRLLPEEEADELSAVVMSDRLEERSNNIEHQVSMEDSRVNASGWLWLNSTPKMGFESSIIIPPFQSLFSNVDKNIYSTWQVMKNRTEYRLRALDVDSRLLGLWHVDYENNVVALPYKQDEEYAQSGLTDIGQGKKHTLGGLIGLLLCVTVVYVWPKRRRIRWRWSVPRSSADKEKGDDEAATLIRGNFDWNSSDDDEPHIPGTTISGK